MTRESTSRCGRVCYGALVDSDLGALARRNYAAAPRLPAGAEIDVLEQIARLLRGGGELFIQTDVEERASLYETHVLGHHDFLPAGDAERSARTRENPYGATSHRERRAIADGIPIHRLRFVRRP